MRLERGMQAPDFVATDHRGQAIRRSEVVGPVWLAFFRYASCPLCNLRVRQIVARHDALAARGLRVLAVFQSPAESIARHAGALDLPFPLLADPGEELYGLYGLETSLLGLLSPGNLGPLARAVGGGLLPGRVEGSVTRIPGDFLIRADGTIWQAYYGRVIADHIPFADVEAFLAAEASANHRRPVWSGAATGSSRWLLLLGTTLLLAGGAGFDLGGVRSTLLQRLCPASSPLGPGPSTSAQPPPAQPSSPDATGPAQALTVIQDADPPVVVVAPPDGAETGEDGLELSVEVSDLTPVAVTVDGDPLEVAAPWTGRATLRRRVALPRYGRRSIAVVARDAAGNEQRVERALTRTAPAFSLRLDEPAEGAALRPPVRVAGQVGGGVSPERVEVRVHGVAIPLGPDGRFALTLSLAEGPHALEALARASTPGGELLATATRELLVDETTPRLTVTAPAEGATTSEERLELQGTVEDESPWVEVKVDGRPVRVARGQPLRVPLALAPGENALLLQATDAAGNAAEPLRLRLRREPVQLPPGLDRLPPGVRPGARPGEWVNDKDGTVLVWIPAGAFRMGSEARGADERPVHEVRFARGFFLGKHETTWAQYRAFCAASGRSLPAKPSWAAEDHPVVKVSWEDARTYCRWAGLRLPSEAEWEYAARGSDGRTYPWGNQEPDGSRLNLYDQDCPESFDWAKAASRDGHGHTATVGSYPAGASPFGALDMAGNVWEWCQDWYQPSYQGAPADGVAWEKAGASNRISRGGCWYSVARDCRAAYRSGGGPGFRDTSLGFRPAR